MIRALSALLVLSSPAVPQESGRFEQESGIDWIRSLGRALERDRSGRDKPKKDRYLLVYVRPPGEVREPGAFLLDVLTAASEGRWTFVLMNFDRRNSWQQTWGVRKAPAVVGCDAHGNAFHSLPRITMDGLKSIIHRVPDSIRRYRASLKIEYSRSLKLLQTNRERGVRRLVEFARQGKTGYPEVNKAYHKLRELAAPALRRADLAESVSPDDGAEYLQYLIGLYGSTPPGVRAEIRMARLDHAQGRVQEAVFRLQNVLRHKPRRLRKELNDAAALFEKFAAAVPIPDRVSRLTEPSDDDQKKATSRIQTLFRIEYVRRSSEGRKLLARMLLKQGIGSAGDPAPQFVCFREAADLASRAGDTATAIAAISELGRWFAVDGSSLKAEVLAQAGASIRSPEAARPLVREWLAAVHEAMDAQDYESAATLADRAGALANETRDASLIESSRNLKSKAVALQKAQSRVRDARKKLETHPDDADANLEVGRFFCLVQGKWATGLPFLARGTDADLKTLAKKELGAPEGAGAQAALGDGWWELGERRKGDRNALLTRAAVWYERAVGALTGLARVKVRKRLDEAYQAHLGGGVIPRNGLVFWFEPSKSPSDPRRDLVSGARGTAGGSDAPEPAGAALKFRNSNLGFRSSAGVERVRGAGSVFAWVRVGDLEQDGGVVTCGAEKYDDFSIWIDDGHVRARLDYPDNPRVFRSEGEIEEGTWTLIGFTWDRKTVLVYVNGDQNGRFPLEDPVGSPQRDRVWIGDNPPGSSNYFQGLIGAAMIYDRPITQEEVSQIHEAGRKTFSVKD